MSFDLGVLDPSYTHSRDFLNKNYYCYYYYFIFTTESRAFGTSRDPQDMMNYSTSDRRTTEDIIS
jgi:hypothetical protein